MAGEVFRSAISALTEDVSGIRPGSTQGWLREWRKARDAIYWSLTDEQHDEIEEICDQWNATGTSGAQKKKLICLPLIAHHAHADLQAI